MDAGLTIILVCSLVAASGALLGPFLLLRRMSLMTDAISHSILLGIVVGFLLFNSTDSLPMILAAGAVGLLTVWLTELIFKTGLVKEDAAIGLVFPALFSIGVILITRLLSDIHIDIDTALVGEVIWAPFDTVTVGGFEISRALLIGGGLLLVNALFVGLFYKELKLVTFDAGLATSLGFSATFLTYALMTLVSVTAVGAFDAVGAVLLVGFMIVPAATAYLLTDRLSRLIPIALLVGVLGCVIGYFVAIEIDASISGTMVTILGLIFILTLILAPERGLLAGWLRRRRQKWEFAARLLLIHIMNHENTAEAKEENAVASVAEHLNWLPQYAHSIMAQAEHHGWLGTDGDLLELTESGRALAQQTLAV
ncbi:MAG: metal ABC transporter permease [Anaerolineae bacterium]|nr:metal ABC transporter permease [Anaerolineae bacterium]